MGKIKSDSSGAGQPLSNRAACVGAFQRGITMSSMHIPGQGIRFFSYAASDLAPIAQEVMAHFKAQGFETQGQQVDAAKWHISLTHPDYFTSLNNQKAGFNINILRKDARVEMHAMLGVYGESNLASFTSSLFTPLGVAQITHTVQQIKLTDEIASVLEQSLIQHSGAAAAGGENAGASSNVPAAPDAAAPAGSKGAEAIFCTQCGAKTGSGADFCSSCGAKLR